MANYFRLEAKTAVLSADGGTENESQIRLYFGVLLGALCKVPYDYYISGIEISVPTIIVSVIASIVVFPQIYAQASLNRGPVTFMRWAVAFQNGFFWSVAIEAIRSQTIG